MSKPFYETKGYIVCNYIYLFIMSTFLMLVVNIPFLISLYVYLSTDTLLIIVYVFSLFIGPSILALMSLMIDVVFNRDFYDIGKKFFKFYKKNFVDGIYYWAIFCIIVLVLNFDRVNIGKMYSQFKFLSPIFFIIELLIVLVAIMTFMLVSRFYMRILQTFKYSIYYTFKEFKNLILSSALIIAVGYAVFKLNILFILFSGVAVYISVFVMKKSLLEIEKNLKNRGEIDETQKIR